MTNPQRPVILAQQRENARVVRKPCAFKWFAVFAQWRAKWLLRRALRVAEEPILVLQVSTAPGTFWAVLAEHKNRLVLSASPLSDALLAVHGRLPCQVADRIKLIPAPLDYSAIGSDSVDCIVASDLPPLAEWTPADIDNLANLHRVTRDTVILFTRVVCGTKRPTRTARAPVDSKGVEHEFQRIGFSQLAHYSFIPGMDPMRVYVLRKASASRLVSAENQGSGLLG